ncbi:MAG TPA: response regulator transcription factor [Actinomycetota bacterium]|nr:response regulator transcription factor [Actinomycetota bacterium]
MDESILFVEDDPSIAVITSKGLEQAGYQVTTESDGRQSLLRFQKGDFDLVVLDVMLPSIDGFEVCRRIRSESQVPILMLTAKTDTVDVVMGLEAGADDYISKPFEMQELVARVRAALRRIGDVNGESQIQIGSLEIDPAGYKLFKDGEPIELTATEFKLLVALARHPGQVMTRELLLDMVWDYDYLGDSRVVDMAIKRLREKIEEDPSNPTTVVTVRGVGYRVEK